MTVQDNGKVPAATKKVIAEVLAGRHDGYLQDIIAAMRERASDGVRFLWRLTWEDDTWTEETVTLGEMDTAERLLSTERRQVSWLEINPRTSAQHAVALIAAHLSRPGAGLTIHEALARTKAISLADMVNVVSEYEVTNAPKE